MATKTKTNEVINPFNIDLWPDSEKDNIPDELKSARKQLGRKLDAYGSLSDETRFVIIRECAKREITVSELCDITSQSQPAVSHHLTILRTLGLIDYRRDGKNNYYSTDKLEVEACKQVLDAILA